jgi:hypothetical protein
MHHPITEGPWAEQTQFHYEIVDDDKRRNLMIDPKIVCGEFRPAWYGASTYLQELGDAPSIDVVPQLESYGRSRSVSVEESEPSTPTLFATKDLEVQNSVAKSDGRTAALQLWVPEAPEPKENTSSTVQEAPSLHEVPSLTRRILRIPPVRHDSVEIMTLLRPWTFPSLARYRKSTHGSLDGYSKRDFEDLVTAGFILEDCLGLKWAANGRYMLFRCDAIRSRDSEINPAHGDLVCSDAQTLFAPPKQPPSAPSSSSAQRPWHRRHQYSHSAPTTPSARPLSILKPDILAVPLLTPWHFPKHALYTEAFPSAMKNTRERDIESLVTSGHLISDAKGIRSLGTNVYQLLYAGQRDEDEKYYTPRIKRLPVVDALRREASVTSLRSLQERPGTPIVVVEMERPGERESPRAVRFNRNCISLDGEGVVGRGVVVDNEGKTGKDIADIEGVSECGEDLVEERFEIAP